MHRLLLPATFVDSGTFQGRLHDVGTYPAAVLSDDPTALVHGEVYRLHDPPATFAHLDEYEGCTANDPTPHEYVRATVPILLATGNVAPAQVYLYHHPVTNLTPIPSGDYLLWCSSRTLSLP